MSTARPTRSGRRPPPWGSLGSTWSITIDSTGLGEGNHDFYVKYVDLAGNESEPSNVQPVFIDHNAPLAPTIEINGNDGDDYFFSDDTYFTNHPNPTFTLGNLEVGTYLDIRINDVPQDVVTVNSTSQLFDPADFNNDGSDDREYTITVVAVDTAGNASDPGLILLHPGHPERRHLRRQADLGFRLRDPGRRHHKHYRSDHHRLCRGQRRCGGRGHRAGRTGPYDDHDIGLQRQVGSRHIRDRTRRPVFRPGHIHGRVRQTPSTMEATSIPSPWTPPSTKWASTW